MWSVGSGRLYVFPTSHSLPALKWLNVYHAHVCNAQRLQCLVALHIRVDAQSQRCSIICRYIPPKVRVRTQDGPCPCVADPQLWHIGVDPRFCIEQTEQGVIQSRVNPNPIPIPIPIHLCPIPIPSPSHLDIVTILVPVPVPSFTAAREDYSYLLLTTDYYTYYLLLITIPTTYY